MVPLPEVAYVGPVGHYHTVPARRFLGPSGEQFLAGVQHLAVVAGRIDHKGERAGLDAGLERNEVFLLELALGNHRRSAVLTGNRGTIGHEMLDGNGHVLRVDMVRVRTLKAEGLLHSHTGLHIRVLAVALPHARPALVAAQVKGRGEDPRNIAGPGLVGADASHLVGESVVERGCKREFLREEGGAGGI